MYKVYSNDVKIYDSRLDELSIFNAKIDLELNKTGAFSFTIYPEHPYFSGLSKLTSIIKVYQDDFLIFRGRVLNIEMGFYNQKQVSCEGELAFLIDSIIRPYEFSGSITEYLSKLINEHNSQVDDYKKFIIGNVTVEDGDTSNNENKITRSDTTYKTTWDLITEKLVNSLGGYLYVRHEADGNYIDYLKDFNVLSNQNIELGKNLLDIKKTVKGEDIATAIIPLGGSGESTITIKTKLDDSESSADDIIKKDDYVYSKSGVSTYGWIFKTVSYSDIESDVDYLLKKAKEDLRKALNSSTTIELTAADLSSITDVNPFRLGRYIKIKSDIHELNSTSDFLVKKLSIDLLNPASNKISIGADIKTFTDKTNSNQYLVTEKINKIEKTTTTTEDLNHRINEVVELNTTSINESSTGIMTQIARDYYLKEDADILVESINTEFVQTKESFDFKFNTFNQNLQELADGNDAQFQEISKYIRFEDGNIILGEKNNELTLKIQNDRISFLESDIEVAYFSNNKLFVTDGEYINSLQLGKFAFQPRTNGNLSFKKIID